MMNSNILITIMLIILMFDEVSLTSREHPFLYYSGRDVTDLRHKARTSHHHIFVRLRQAAEEMKRNPHIYTPPKNWSEFSRAWNEIYGNSLGSLAFYCVLNDTDHEAFELAKTIIARFTLLRNWRCALNLDDDVPVAHSLVAVATAYDFLWDRLDERQRQSTAFKITQELRIMYKRSFQKWWGKVYIQNHMATNYVALLTGALVVENRTNEAYLWIRRAHKMLNRTMFLLAFVKDGTLEEGVSYGSYTSRSLTQYISLAKRHLNVDLTNNAWLKQHFWFLYRTILPTFDEALGIADSNGKWFYGPESQLVFLDNMVLKNGFGNWLAKQIERKRKDGRTLFLANAHRFATLHSEFLFYDHNIEEKPPPDLNVPSVHVFEDWGVAVFGCGAGMSRDYSVDRYGDHNPSYKTVVIKDPFIESKMNENNDKGIVNISSSDSSTIVQFGGSRLKLLTFVSFKCGVLHGRAINNIVKTKPWPWIKEWRSFNPGHEHPDHGSFTFYPNGVPFITEALYGPKYTWLNNVLSFGPSSSDHGGFTGQLTESTSWVRFKGDRYWKAKGTILAALRKHEMVYMAGEYSDWYNKELGLKEVFRAVLLIRSDVLLVCDVILTKVQSKVNKMSAFFHNRFAPFSIKEEENGLTFAELMQQGKAHRVHWVSSSRKPIDVKSRSAEFKAENGQRKTNFINITTPIDDQLTAMAYVFTGSDLKLRQLHLSINNHNDTVTVTFSLKDTFYKIAAVSRPKQGNRSPLEMRFSDYVNVTTVEGKLDQNIFHRSLKPVVSFSILLIFTCICRFIKLKTPKKAASKVLHYVVRLPLKFKLLLSLIIMLELFYILRYFWRRFCIDNPQNAEKTYMQ